MAPPMPYGHPSSGLHVGLKAIGALLPAFGQLLGAYRRSPERPEITGEPQRDGSPAVGGGITVAGSTVVG